MFLHKIKKKTFRNVFLHKIKKKTFRNVFLHKHKKEKFQECSFCIKKKNLEKLVIKPNKEGDMIDFYFYNFSNYFNKYNIDFFKNTN